MQFLKFYKNTFVRRVLLLPTVVLFLCCFSHIGYAQKKYTVVLDAGHGGKDYGASRDNYKEKKIALRVALDIGKELLTSKDIQVHYTRKKDVFVELHNRAKIANTKQADLFVSIHCNANNSDKPHGAETYVLGLNGNEENFEIAKKENAVILLEDDYKKNYDYDPNSPESVIGLSMLQEENLDLSLAFGGFIQNNFRNLKRYDRKVRQANFLVLRETVMPSVLIELGFISNKAEGKFLNTRQGQIKMAKAIAKAIKGYFKRLKLNTVSQSTPLEVTVVKNKKTPVKKPIVKDSTLPKKEEEKVTPIVAEKLAPTKIDTKDSKDSKESMKQIVKVVVEKPKNTIPETAIKLPEVKEPLKKPTPVNKDKEVSVLFRVQIAASKVKLSTESYNFKGLENVVIKEIDEYYKYFYGKSTSFQEIKNILIEVKAAGFEDAWVVAFKNGERISLKEAFKSI